MFLLLHHSFSWLFIIIALSNRSTYCSRTRTRVLFLPSRSAEEYRNQVDKYNGIRNDYELKMTESCRVRHVLFCYFKSFSYLNSTHVSCFALA